MNRIAQLYGYTVCLVAIITFLVASAGVVEALFDLSGAGSRGSIPDASMSSFEAYKASKLMGRQQTGPVPDDQLLRALYEGDRARGDAERAERRASARREATENLIKSLLLIGISAGLFAAHWKWTKKLRAAET